MLVLFSGVCFLFVLIQVTLMILYIWKIRQSKTAMQHVKIQAAAFFGLTCRGLWFLCACYYFHDTLTVASQECLNIAAMYLCFLELSFYVQTWMRVILLVNHVAGELAVKIIFYSLDIAVSLVGIISIIVRYIVGQ